jgi:hypothetical protein
MQLAILHKIHVFPFNLYDVMQALHTSVALQAQQFGIVLQAQQIILPPDEYVTVPAGLQVVQSFTVHTAQVVILHACEYTLAIKVMKVNKYIN